MRFFKISFVSILIFIILLLVGYILLSGSGTLLRVSLNYILHKYSVSANFSKLRASGKGKVVLENFSFRKRDFSFRAPVLVVKVGESDRLNLRIKNPVVVVNVAGGKGSSSVAFPSYVGSVRIENLTLVLERDGRKLGVAEHVNVSLSNGKIKFSGEFKYSHGDVSVDARINAASGVVSIKRGIIFVRSLDIEPTGVLFSKGDLRVMVRRKIKLSNIIIQINPLRIDGFSIAFTPVIHYSRINTGLSCKLDVKRKGELLLFSGVLKNVHSPSLKVNKFFFSGGYNGNVVLSGRFSGVKGSRWGVIGENIRGRLHVVKSTVTIVVHGGELAYGLWYNDFSKHVLFLRLCYGKRFLFRVSLGGIFRLDGEYLSRRYVSFDLSSSDAGGFVNAVFVSPYGDNYPFLKRLAVSGTFRVMGRYIFAVRGFSARLKGRFPRISLAENEFLNVSVDLPIYFGTKGERKGFLSIGRVKTGCCSFPVRVNVFSFEGGMRLDISTISFRGVHISFQPFTLRLHPLLFRGGIGVIGIEKDIRFSGNFWKIEGNKDEVRCHGKLIVHAFGGRVIVDNVVIHSPFSFPMSVGMNVLFSHINLKLLTEDTNFGLVTGYIKGYIKGLVLVGYQPQRFDMLVETQRVSGVRKVIAIKAINNLARISGGYAALAMPFFKTLPYSWIGFKCSLRNDLFVIHGLQRRDDKEYIVKKGFLIGVNVVVDRRGNKIIWSDMINRIRHVIKGG